jgi:hypothetical protein
VGRADAEKRIEGAALRSEVCAVVAHGRLDRFVNWVYFIRHFFPPGRKPTDIITRGEALEWMYFDIVFEMIAPGDGRNE